jgi:hypothetical protein
MMTRAVVAAALLIVVGGSAMAQPCNPIIDGTYCATQMRPRPDGPAVPDTRFRPIESIGRDVMRGQDQPGTLGAISWGGQQCIGLLRRGACN